MMIYLVIGLIMLAVFLMMRRKDGTFILPSWLGVLIVIGWMIFLGNIAIVLILKRSFGMLIYKG